MKYIKSYKLYESNESSFPKTREEIEALCEGFNFDGIYTINDDLTIDVDGDVYLDNEGFTKLPVRFRNVSGDFDCSSNSLTDFEGCPITVGGAFNGKDNNVNTLKFFPNEIAETIDLSDNKICNIDNDYLLSNDSWLEEFLSCDFSDNPLQKLLSYLRNILYQENKEDDDFKSIYDRLHEFEVIKDNRIDLLSMENLYNFYNIDFDSSQFSKCGYKFTGEYQTTDYEEEKISNETSLIMRTEYARTAFYLKVKDKAIKIDKSTYRQISDGTWFTWQGKDDAYES